MTMLPPNAIVCRHCKQPVMPAELSRNAHKRFGFGWQDSRHAIAELVEDGLDSNRRRTAVRRRVLVCLVGLTRWH